MHEIKETFDFAKRHISISDIYDANVDVVLFEGNCDELIRHIPTVYTVRNGFQVGMR